LEDIAGKRIQLDYALATEKRQRQQCALWKGPKSSAVAEEIISVTDAWAQLYIDGNGLSF